MAAWLEFCSSKVGNFFVLKEMSVGRLLLLEFWTYSVFFFVVETNDLRSDDGLHVPHALQFAASFLSFG